MNTTLTVDDPLADQGVTIVITLAAGKQARDERPALVSVGVTGQPPVTRTGTFGQVTPLINQAWTAFGVQAQVTAVQDTGTTAPVTIPEGEIPDTAVPDTKSTMPQPHAPASNPQPDLSILF